MTDRVLVVDFGSQVTQLIARRVRESGVYCEIHPCTKVDAAFLARFAPRAIILSGGPASVTEADTPRAARALLAGGLRGACRCRGGRRGAGRHSYERNFSSMRSSFSSCRPMRASM
jgi:GMP synthase (glutamine-hydrolysing)